MKKIITIDDGFDINIHWWLSWLYHDDPNIELIQVNKTINDDWKDLFDKDNIFCININQPRIEYLSDSKFISQFKEYGNNSKLIIFDIEGENFTKQKIDVFELVQYSQNNNISLISARFDTGIFNSPNIYFNHFKLFLTWFFFLSKITFLPKLQPFPISKNRPYDFIYYYGKRNDELSEHRKNKTIDKINLHDKKILISNMNYRDTSYFKTLNYTYENSSLSNFFNYNELLQAHFSLVVETNKFDTIDQDLFFSEKTSRALMYGMPSFLLIHEKLKEWLMDNGFSFPENTSSLDKTIDYISNLCTTDLYNWLEDNKHYFRDNQDRYYEIVQSRNDEVHDLLNKIIF